VTGSVHERRDVAIEFGHAVLLPQGGYDDPEGVRMSARYAEDLRSTLSVAGLTTTIQVLIDDKRISRQDGRAEAIAKFSADCQAALQTDCFVLESSLVRLLDQFTDQVITPTARARIARKLADYYHQHNELACSHDIALWHALRLGLLNPNALPSDVCRISGIHGTFSPCRVAVSILPARAREYEAIAATDLLRHAGSIVPDRQIHQFYFLDRGQYLDLGRAEWLNFKDQISRSAT
jgi:hypothetical protein